MVLDRDYSTTMSPSNFSSGAYTWKAPYSLSQSSKPSSVLSSSP